MGRYMKSDRCEVVKAFISFVTVMQLYYLFDYYDYVVAGAKKEWYKLLYSGENPGPMPRFSTYLGPFIAEFIVLMLHCPPYFDFRFWEDATGTKKVFIGDKMGVFIMLRLYAFVRVIRDYSNIFARRRLVYDGGYRNRGGQEIDSTVALK